MLFRVTNQLSIKQFLDQVNTNRRELDISRDRIGTGVKVLNPSDDPARTGFILGMQRTVVALERHEQRIASATGYLQTQDTALQASETTLLRAKEIATQAANETLSPELRATLAEEVIQLRDTLQGLANTNYRGIYLWGGVDDDDPPFDTVAAPGYATGSGSFAERYVYDADPGSQSTRTVAVDQTEEVRLNTPGDIVFSHAISGLERLARALKGFRSDPPDYYDDGNGNFVPPAINDFTELPVGTGAAYTFPQDFKLQSQDIYRCIDYIEFSRLNCIGSETVDVGARLGTLESTKGIVESIRISTEESRSAVQDAEMFETSSRFQSLMTNLEALLASGARIDDLMLLDYI